jgi:hypothetical protein
MENGCEYCTGEVDYRPSLLSNDWNEGVYIGGNFLHAADDLELESKEINFCPMCGRKL